MSFNNSGKDLKYLSENESQLSIVIPAYNEEGNIHRLYDELMNYLPSLKVSWEIVFVDDGSTDKTWNKILSLNKNDRNVKGIRLTRNFGHQYALLAGLFQVSGRAIIIMDADLQHPPSLIPRLVEEWQKGNKIVNTLRIDAIKTSFFKKASSNLFYKIFSFLSGVKIEKGMADFRLLDRQVIDIILRFREEHLFLRGLFQWVGFQNSTVHYQCQDRFSGMSKYTLKKMIRLASDGITSFSLVPLRISIFVGLITSAIAFGGIIYAVYIKLFTDRAVQGWSSVVAILSFLFGILFILLGVVGEYIGKIFIQVRRRPRFIINEYLGYKNIVEDDFL